MSKNKYMLYLLLVMLLWGMLFPMVKLGYGAYNIPECESTPYFYLPIL